MSPLRPIQAEKNNSVFEIASANNQPQVVHPWFFEFQGTGPLQNSQVCVFGANFQKSAEDYPKELIEKLQSCDLLITDISQEHLTNEPELLRRKEYYKILATVYDKFLSNHRAWFSEKFSALEYSDEQQKERFQAIDQARRNYLGLQFNDSDINELVEFAAPQSVEAKENLIATIKESQRGNQEYWYHGLTNEALKYVRDLLGTIELSLDETPPVLVEDLVMQQIDTRNYPINTAHEVILKSFLDTGKAVFELSSYESNVVSQIAIFTEVLTEFDVMQTINDINEFVAQIQADAYSDDEFEDAYDHPISLKKLENAEVESGTLFTQKNYMKKITEALSRGEKSVAIVVGYSYLQGSHGILSSLRNLGFINK